MSRVAGHPGVVGLRAVFEDDKEVHLVMDLCEGGELFDEVVRLGRLSERDAALIFRQLASGVAFCHSRGVLHRDLKPENILLHRSAPSGAVPASPAADSALAAPQSLESRGLTAKLADFGLSIALDNGRMGYGTAGSPFYMAPEVLTGEYEYAADVWSLGVILYIMLCGRPPFWGKTDAAVYDAILRGKLDFSGPAWAGSSVEARSLIRCMLQSDPRRRPTAVKVLSHPWVLLHLYGIRAVKQSVVDSNADRRGELDDRAGSAAAEAPIVTVVEVGGDGGGGRGGGLDAAAGNARRVSGDGGSAEAEVGGNAEGRDCGRAEQNDGGGGAAASADPPHRVRFMQLQKFLRSCDESDYSALTTCIPPFPRPSSRSPILPPPPPIPAPRFPVSPSPFPFPISPSPLSSSLHRFCPSPQLFHVGKLVKSQPRFCPSLLAMSAWDRSQFAAHSEKRALQLGAEEGGGREWVGQFAAHMDKRALQLGAGGGREWAGQFAARTENRAVQLGVRSGGEWWCVGEIVSWAGHHLDGEGKKRALKMGAEEV
ncbi:unnamed protein product [Closterium sp. NIES-64]|nr:unnamed protein product [Closterium sp. NIES-64]